MGKHPQQKGKFTANPFGTRVKGNYIETMAAAYLRRLGYELLARNYAYRGGELDIVAKDGETIVFV